MRSPTLERLHATEKNVLKKIPGQFRDLDNFFLVAGLRKNVIKKKKIAFKAALVQTRGFKFNREEANA